jgi:histidinol-phosphatase (PHP family)
MSVQTAALPPDCHVLSPLGKQARGRPEEYARVAAQLGLPEITVADRCPSPHRYDEANRMDMSDLEAYLAWQGQVAESPGATPTRLGLEADFYQGCYVFQSEFLGQLDLDLVLGTVRYQSFWARDPSERTLYDKSELMPVWRRYFKLVGLLVESGLYDAVSCFDLPKREGRLPRESTIRDCALPALDRMAQYGVALEINTSGLRDPVHEIYPSPQILAWARERNIAILFGSSAGAPEQVGHGFADAVRLAKQAGYTQYARYQGRRRTLVPLE